MGLFGFGFLFASFSRSRRHSKKAAGFLDVTQHSLFPFPTKFTNRKGGCK